jgi:hypothetical protein
LDPGPIWTMRRQKNKPLTWIKRLPGHPTPSLVTIMN